MSEQIVTLSENPTPVQSDTEATQDLNESELESLQNSPSKQSKKKRNKKKKKNSLRDHQDDGKTHAKVVPPFKSISSFSCAAVILSYYGFFPKVNSLLMALSRNTQRYKVSHWSLLKSYLQQSLGKLRPFNDVKF